MRGLALAVALLALAGCSAPAAPGPVATPASQASPAVTATLVDGTFAWHETAVSENAVVTRAVQPVAHSCVFQGKPYLTNRDLPVERGLENVTPPGTLGIDLDWTDLDYVGTTLVVAFRPAGSDNYSVSPPVTRGDHLDVAVPPPANASANATAAGADQLVTGWAVSLCLVEGNGNVTTPGWTPAEVTGSIKAKLTFTPSP